MFQSSYQIDESLRALDLGILATAAFYDLNEIAERQRSVADLERLFFRMCGIVQPDLFIEAGAKSAVTSQRARRHLKDARIVAFEANPYTYKRFASDSGHGKFKVEYLNKALSVNEKDVKFNVRIVDGRASADGQGSILSRTDPRERSEQVTVAATRLDAFFPKDSFKECCIWMDVEGALEPVLNGATGMLDDVCFLYVEIEDRTVWEGQWLSKQVMEHLYAFGLVPIARDYQSRYQYNVLFANRSTLHRSRVRFAMTEHMSYVGCRQSQKST